MKRIIPVLLIVFSMQAQESLDLKQQLALYKKHEKGMIKQIHSHNLEQFEHHLKIFKGEKEEAKPNYYFSFMHDLATKNDELLQKISTLISKEKENTEIIDIEQKKKEILKNIKEKLKARKYILQDKEYQWISWEKIRSAFEYFLATLGLASLGILSYVRTLDYEDCVYLEPLVLTNLFKINSVVLPLKANAKTTVSLFGLSGITAYYGLQDLYQGLRFNSLTKQNLNNIREMEKLIKKKNDANN